MGVVGMPTVIILMVATGVSAGQDSREMDTIVQVSYLKLVWYILFSYCSLKPYDPSLRPLLCGNNLTTAIRMCLHYAHFTMCVMRPLCICLIPIL